MTADELEAFGLYQCPHCLSTWESEKALMFCCRDEYDLPSIVRSYD